MLLVNVDDIRLIGYNLFRSLKHQKYTVIVVNKSDSPIYYRGSFDLFSNAIYNNEKIYDVTLPLHYKQDMFDINKGHNCHFDIYSKINNNTTRKVRIIGEINNKNLRRENVIDSLENRQKSFCSNIHFILYFTKHPYTINTYAEYIEIMKSAGYATVGHLNKRTLLFTIKNVDFRISNDAITNPLHFVHEMSSRSVN